MEVAGKWHNTSEHGATANCIAINEIQIQGQALTPVDVNGNTSIGTYWNNTTIWGNSNLVDSNSAYGATHSTAFIFTDNAAEIDKYSRVAFSMSYPNIPLITEVYIGNQDYRIPKRITFYYCNSYDKTANLLNRSNEGLSLLGYVDIPENTTESTKFEVHLREPIEFNGIYLSPIKLSKRISTSKQKLSADNLKTLTDKVKTQVARKLCLNKMTIRDASHTLKIVDNISNTIRCTNESNSIGVSDTKKLIRATRKSIAQNTMALRSNSNAINSFDLKVNATKQYKDKIINIKSVYKLGQELLGSYKFSINGVVITPHSGELSNVSTIDFCISNPQVLNLGSNNCVIEYKLENGTVKYLRFEIVKEATKREVVTRTFQNYDGGYIGDHMDSGRSINKYPCYLVPNGQDSTIIHTSSQTNIPLSKYTGILGVNIDSSDAKILVSFDNKTTWKTIKKLIGYSLTENAGINLIPTMTSNIAPTGSASASSELNSTYLAYKAFDRSTGTYWISANTAGVASLQYKFDKLTAVNSYKVLNTGIANTVSPDIWTFRGSLDGNSWTILDSQSGQSSLVVSGKEYKFANNTPYLYYKLDITSSPNKASVYVGTLEMYGPKPIYGWGDVPIEDILTYGMSNDEISSITKEKWNEVFSQTSLDFAIYLSNSLSSYVDLSREKLLYSGGPFGGSYNMVSPEGYRFTNVNAQITGNDSWDKANIYADIYTNGVLTTIKPNNNYFINTNYGEYNRQAPERIRLYYNPSGPVGIRVYYAYAAPKYAYLRSITVTLPPNQPPVIQNIALSPSTVHAGGATLTGLITDKEDDDIQYRISINNQEDLIPWNQLSSGSKEINTIIPVDLSPVGTNAITIEASDGDKMATPTTVYLTRTNDNPTITGVLTGDCLRAAVGDPEGDAVKYRILVNEKVKQNWTEFMASPAIVDYRVSAQDVIINEQNSVIIEAQDNMGGIGKCVFDFVGQYYNIMFMDEYGDYYSDDKGQMLKALDLGSFLIRQSSEAKPVIIKNTTGMLLKDIVISSDPKDDTVIELSLTKEDFDRRNSITLPVILGNGDTYTIYIKARTDKEQAIGKNALKLYVTANHA